jgi:hypothetical protein
VIIAPPWEGAFWIEAGRAEMVNYKRAPHSRAILEWYRACRRSTAEPSMNAARTRSMSCSKITRSWTQPRSQLGERYGADYFLATRELSPVPGAGRLVYATAQYFLYQLSR